MIDAAKFVEAWERSTNTREVADKTGLAPKEVNQLASFYRGRGVSLKRMGRRGTKVDVTALNGLIASIGASG